MLLLVVKARLAVQPNALSPFLPTLLFTHHPAGEGGPFFVGWVGRASTRAVPLSGQRWAIGNSVQYLSLIVFSYKLCDVFMQRKKTIVFLKSLFTAAQSACTSFSAIMPILKLMIK